MLSSMPDEFIPKGISSRVVIMEEDSFKHEGYGANLVKNNEENDLYHAIGFVGMSELGLLSGYIYTDVNKYRQNLFLKLISAIYKLSDDNATENHNEKPKPAIRYNLHSDGKPLNDWDNPDFFLIAFNTIFFYGNDGHIVLQSTKMSLDAWAK